MTYTLPADPNITAPAEGGQAKPLPENTRVLATILSTRKDAPSLIEKRPYAKEGPNSKIMALNPRFRIANGQRGAGRNVFGRVPLAYKFASGKDCTAFYGFFRALGYDVDPASGFTVPEDHEMLGEEIELVLGVEQDGDKVNDDGSPVLQNVVKFFNKPRPIEAYQDQGAPASSAPAWTPPGAAASAPAAPAAPAQPAWLPPGAQAAPSQAPDPAVTEQIQAGAESGNSF